MHSCGFWPAVLCPPHTSECDETGRFFLVFSHTECDSSDHPVSVVVVVVGVNFFSLSTSSLEGYSSLFKSRLYDLFSQNYANELLGS